MEGIIQEQSHVCKICNKTCVSGRSLGGHMRIHLAQISDSKKMEFDHSSSLRKRKVKKESNSFSPIQKRIKTGFLDIDLNNNSYELRYNPQKSYRFDNLKTEFSEYAFSCKECAKEFASTRALSGHMRCHSIKKKEIHECKTCGKGFDSMRAMFGHMKTHSKKSRAVVDVLSDFDTFCSVRRKRSRIRYKTPPHSSFSSLNESVSAISEVSEVELAAATLVMLSKGVTGPIRFDSTSCDGSEYFGTGNIEKIASENNVSRFVANNKMEDVFESFVDLMRCVETGLKFGKQVSGDSLGSVDRFKKHDELNGSSIMLESACELKSFDPSNFTENEMDETIPESLKTYCVEKPSVCVQHTCSDNSSHVNHVGQLGILNSFEKNLEKLDRFNNQIDRESEVVEVVSLDSSKRKKHECALCFAVFSSGQALGGHKRAHYKGVTECKIEEVTDVNQEVVGIKDLFTDLNFPADVGSTNAEVGRNLWWVESSSQQMSQKNNDNSSNPSSITEEQNPCCWAAPYGHEDQVAPTQAYNGKYQSVSQQTVVLSYGQNPNPTFHQKQGALSAYYAALIASGVPLPNTAPKETKMWCEVCKIFCDTQDVLDIHKSGKKHKKNLENIRGLTNTNTFHRNTNINSARKKMKVVQWCEVCKIACDTKAVLDIHKSGKKHKMNLEQLRGGPTNTNPCQINTNRNSARKKTTVVQWCEVCKIACDTKAVLDIHKSGKKHKENLEKLRGLTNSSSALAIIPRAPVTPSYLPLPISNHFQ